MVRTLPNAIVVLPNRLITLYYFRFIGLHTYENVITLPSPGSYGWYGFGGSVIQWHPETKIAFGFVPTFMYGLDSENLRGRRVLAEAIRCAKLKL